VLVSEGVVLDILVFGHFGFRTFWVLDNVVSDILVFGHFGFRTFCFSDILVFGHFGFWTFSPSADMTLVSMI
jgi:hypothetical protein